MCDVINELKEMLKSFLITNVEKVFNELEKLANEQGTISLEDIRKEYVLLTQNINGMTHSITEVSSCIGLIHQSAKTMFQDFKYVFKPLLKDIKAKKPLKVLIGGVKMKEKIEQSIKNIILIFEEIEHIIEENSLSKAQEELIKIINQIKKLVKWMQGYNSMVGDFRKFFMKKLEENLNFDNNPIENYLRNFINRGDEGYTYTSNFSKKENSKTHPLVRKQLNNIESSYNNLLTDLKDYLKETKKFPLTHKFHPQKSFYLIYNPNIEYYEVEYIKKYNDKNNLLENIFFRK